MLKKTFQNRTTRLSNERAEQFTRDMLDIMRIDSDIQELEEALIVDLIAGRLAR